MGKAMQGKIQIAAILAGALGLAANAVAANRGLSPIIYEYYKNLYATFIDEKLRFLKAVVKSPANPYLCGVNQAMDVKTEIEQLDAEKEKYKNENRTALKNYERFARGTLENEYQSAYWLLCLDSHNNLNVIEKRHIEKNGDDYNVALFKAENQEDILRDMDLLLATFMDSTAKIHQFLETKPELHYQKYNAAFNLIRKQYQA